MEGTEPGAVDYRTLVEQIPAITYTEVHDPSTPTGQRTTYVSPQATRILGHAPSEFLADPELWRKLRHPADRAKVMAAERTAEVTKQPFQVEYRMRTRDGRMIWFRDEAVIVEEPKTGGTFWQGVMFDITAEKETEEKARLAELRFKTLVESLPAVVYIDSLDERATNVYTSPRSLDILGYSQQDWEKDPDLWAKILHREDFERAIAAQAHHVETGEPFDETYRVIAKDGRVVWLRDVAVILHDEEGVSLYSQGFLLDITAQVEAETELKESLEREHEQAERLRALDTLKNTLLHTLSHDLKSPLTAILTAANALQRPELDLSEQEARDLLAGMADRAKRMDRLMTDLLDLDRIGRGILEPNRFPVDVGRLVADFVQSTDTTAGRDVRIEVTPVTVAVDSPKVERIVENLLANALRHTSKESHIWVRVQPHGDGVAISVEDDGPGIPDGLKEIVFEPFRQGPDVGGHRPQGTGLGLSLVARFAELHGGRAWVEDRPGGGSCFRVLLPGRPVE